MDDFDRPVSVFWRNCRAPDCDAHIRVGGDSHSECVSKVARAGWVTRNDEDWWCPEHKEQCK